MFLSKLIFKFQFNVRKKATHWLLEKQILSADLTYDPISSVSENLFIRYCLQTWAEKVMLGYFTSKT